MRTKTTSKILSETSEETKEKVRNNANNLINKKISAEEKLKRFYDLAVAEDEQQDFIYLNEKIKRIDLEFLKEQ